MLQQHIPVMQQHIPMLQQHMLVLQQHMLMLQQHMCASSRIIPNSAQHELGIGLSLAISILYDCMRLYTWQKGLTKEQYLKHVYFYLMVSNPQFMFCLQYFCPWLRGKYFANSRHKCAGRVSLKCHISVEFLRTE